MSEWADFTAENVEKVLHYAMMVIIFSFCQKLLHWKWYLMKLLSNYWKAKSCSYFIVQTPSGIYSYWRSPVISYVKSTLQYLPILCTNIFMSKRLCWCTSGCQWLLLQHVYAAGGSSLAHSSPGVTQGLVIQLGAAGATKGWDCLFTVTLYLIAFIIKVSFKTFIQLTAYHLSGKNYTLCKRLTLLIRYMYLPSTCILLH